MARARPDTPPGAKWTAPAHGELDGLARVVDEQGQRRDDRRRRAVDEEVVRRRAGEGEREELGQQAPGPHCCPQRPKFKMPFKLEPRVSLASAEDFTCGRRARTPSTRAR